jgi:hypothetical protein
MTISIDRNVALVLFGQEIECWEIRNLTVLIDLVDSSLIGESRGVFRNYAVINPFHYSGKELKSIKFTKSSI